MTTSLISAHKSSDSLRVHLHPLILLTISDYITRHTLRRQTKPIVGALLGQQNGRDITLEYAFEAETTTDKDDQPILNDQWFEERLQQYKDVHQAPVLELLGWFTTAPVTGPAEAHLGIHQQILKHYNETAVLLAFHPSSVLEGATVGGKLPLTIYESVYESLDSTDRSMDIDGQEASLELKFRELPYSVETGEAEMIGVDFVARGGGNATAVDTTQKKGEKDQGSQKPVGQVDVKGKAVQRDTPETKVADDSSYLSAEDEELIASLTARVNAVKMLHSRISLLKAYLESLPPSYLNTPEPSSTTETPIKSEHDAPATAAEINHPLLRSILALLTRLPLLLPPEQLSAFNQETLAEKSDVQLAALLGEMGRSVKEMKEMGRKFAVVEQVRSQGKKQYLNMNSLGSEWENESGFGSGQSLMDDGYMM